MQNVQDETNRPGRRLLPRSEKSVHNPLSTIAPFACNSRRACYSFLLSDAHSDAWLVPQADTNSCDKHELVREPGRRCSGSVSTWCRWRGHVRERLADVIGDRRRRRIGAHDVRRVIRIVHAAGLETSIMRRSAGGSARRPHRHRSECHARDEETKFPAVHHRISSQGRLYEIGRGAQAAGTKLKPSSRFESVAIASPFKLANEHASLAMKTVNLQQQRAEHEFCAGP